MVGKEKEINMEIKDKVILITGASAGIGYAAAQLLWKDGAKLAVNARSKEKLDQLAREAARVQWFSRPIWKMNLRYEIWLRKSSPSLGAWTS